MSYQNNFQFTILIDKINDIINNKGWEKYQDIHLTDVFYNLQRREWLEASFLLITEACKLINDNYVLILAISLDDSKKLNTYGGNLGYPEITEALDYSPPSLYLFPKESDIIQKSLIDAQKINIKNKENSKISFYLKPNDGVLYLLQG